MYQEIFKMLSKKAKPLKDPTDAEHAYGYALFLLNLRMQTETEMREKMQRRGYALQVINNSIERLYKDRYLDDNKFAELSIENMKLYKNYGYYGMKKKLIEKKLPKNIIEEKLNELVDVSAEKEIAKKYLKKEFGTISEIKKLPYEEKQKVMRRLLSRGFRMEIIELIK